MAMNCPDVVPAVALFRSLVDPARLAIMLRLGRGEARVVDLTRRLGLAQSTVSEHLACLRDCCLIDSRAEGRQSYHRLVRPELLDLLRSAETVLGSAGAVADSRQTLLCTYLSAAVLVGLVLTATLGRWWADPVAALVLAAVAVREGGNAWRGEGCCAPQVGAVAGADACPPTAVADGPSDPSSGRRRTRTCRRQDDVTAPTVSDPVRSSPRRRSRHGRRRPPRAGRRPRVWPAEN